MKVVKLSVDILEGLSIGVNMDVSFTSRSRPCSDVLNQVVVIFLFAPHAPACRRNLWRDLKILVPLRTAVLQLPLKSYVNRTKRS